MNRLIIPLAQNINLSMIKIPGGSFMMGSDQGEPEKRENEMPRHRVELSSFYLGQFPVTQRQYFAVLKTLPDTSPEFLGENLPAVNVWLEKALEFCAGLSQLAGRPFRLPAEAEWEYACRAGTTTAFNCGQKLPAETANFNWPELEAKPPQDLTEKRLTPVGFFNSPNAFGLYDMHGNVWEWCADVWHENYCGAPADGSAWLENGDQGYCVQRGGSWRDRAGNCRSAFRVGDVAHNSENIVGLRVCLSAEQV